MHADAFILISCPSTNIGDPVVQDAVTLKANIVYKAQAWRRVEDILQRLKLL